MHLAEAGSFDLFALYTPTKRAAWLEVKTKDSDLSENQRVMQRMLRQCGQTAEVVRSAAEAVGVMINDSEET